jgi:hypothetical protein
MKEAAAAYGYSLGEARVEVVYAYGIVGGL